MSATASVGTGPTLTIRCQFCLTWNRVAAERVADRPKCGKCARPMLLDRPWPLDDETFARTVAEAGVPVLVDFFATWCAPCRMMAPAVDEVAARLVGRALVAKLDTDRAPETAQRFRIRGVPTSIAFRDGAEVGRQTGAVPRATLEQLLAAAGVSA